MTAYLRAHGGVRPAQRRRDRQHPTAAEREEISRGIAAGTSARTIAAALDRPASTVSREIARNGGRAAYRAGLAEAATWDRARRPKPTLLGSDPRPLEVVRGRLEQDWSPEQIAVWLRRQYPAAPSMRIPHESIHRSIYYAGRREPPA